MIRRDVVTQHKARGNRAAAVVPWRPYQWRAPFDDLAQTARAYCIDAVDPASGSHRASLLLLTFVTVRR